MQLEYLLLVLPVAYTLKCVDKTIGSANGTTFNYENTLSCPDGVNWCMNLNGSFALPGYSIDGILGNCEVNGFVGAFVKKIKEVTTVDISCKMFIKYDISERNAISKCKKCVEFKHV
ncbi:hypothetical protein OESDEN_00279 [Oesophagostomum dentatum]|uniref:Uncharacterized protein n=1 Tax=Oesophagostomum dentatum TaxID=61180 RepID=A0A0B1TQC5_OESDE|nr:hypothetical protein OESDEN_00279 [Oesophagostomum dentatum]